MSDDAAPPPVILVDVVDGVAVITLNRPEARNALNAELAAAFPLAVAECDARDDVGAIVLTGADPAFCAGFDLRDVGGGKKTGENPHPGYWGALPPTTKPVIGAINGAVATGGLEIAVACDLLIASENARFADTHAKVGVLPGWGLTIELPKAIGMRRAVQMSLSGEFVDARTALEWGLVNEVVPHEDLLPRAISLGGRMAANTAMREVRALYAEIAAMGDGPDAWEHENRRARDWMKQRFG